MARPRAISPQGGAPPTRGKYPGLMPVALASRLYVLRGGNRLKKPRMFSMSPSAAASFREPAFFQKPPIPVSRTNSRGSRKESTMDSTTLIGISAALAVLTTLGIFGYRTQCRIKAHMAEVTQEVLSQNPHAEILGQVAYHGGFPRMPKPAMLQLGVTKDSLVLYDYKQWCDKVCFRDWRSVEKFTILVKADTIGKSTVMLGPLVPFFFKDKLRHFIAIKYFDTNYEENNLLLETNDEKTQERIYEKISFLSKNLCVV